MLAVDKGYFKDLGIEVEVKSISSSADRVRAVTSGAAAFSNLGRIAVISEMANDNKTFYSLSPMSTTARATRGAGRVRLHIVQGPERQEGRPPNTSAQITMNGLLESEGMTEKDVQFVNLPGGEMAGAIARSDVDAACVWEPLFTNVRNAAPGGKLLGLDSDTPNFKKFGTMASPDIMIISKKLVDENPEGQPRRSLPAIFRGVKYTHENPTTPPRPSRIIFRQEPSVVLAAMKQFKYFGADNWQEHMKLHTGQMEFLPSGWSTMARSRKCPTLRLGRT